MSQDLRELFEGERDNKHRMKQGHESRFLTRLDTAMPIQEKSRWRIWSAAASAVILLGIGVYFFSTTEEDLPAKTTVVDKTDDTQKEHGISLGDLSPDLRNLEDYYMANINLEISQLEVSAENKELVDNFMERLSDLNIEYNELNKELNAMGPNDQTISALIQNLQLRLDLLLKLKNKLNELKSSKNGQVKNNTI
ncbi:MAG: hypothetical protein WBM43_14630 [Flavobacteriaceae bacterium]